MSNNQYAAELLVTYNGETKPLIQWCKDLGINYHTLYSRWQYAKEPPLQGFFEEYVKRKLAA